MVHESIQKWKLGGLLRAAPVVLWWSPSLYQVLRQNEDDVKS